MTSNKLAGLSAFMIGISIAFGAMGAHALEKVFSTHYLEVWKTACLYFALNGLGLMAVANSGLYAQWVAEKSSTWFVKSIVFGAMIFSISLWIVAFNEQVSPILKKIAIITPFGGIAMILGWLGLGWRFWKNK